MRKSPISTLLQRVALLACASALAVTTGCSGGGDDPLSPEQATTSVTAGTAAQVSGTVGATVTPAPSVKAVDAAGRPVAGLPVTFTVTGGGTIGRTSVTTDATGTATVGSWTLGTTAGQQAVVATAGTRTVTFTASATAAAAATISAVAGATVDALTGAAVANRPSVQVKDQYGNPVAGATVTFAVVTGGGSITGATATTDATGTATVGGWTLGVEPGAQTLRASAGALSTTFGVTAALPTGCTAAPYAVGARILGNWATADCASPGGRGAFDPAGARYDQYELTLATQQTIVFRLAAPGARTIRIRRKAGATDYVTLALGTVFTTTSGDTIVNRVVLAPDTYVVEVQSGAAGATGGYTLQSSVESNTDITCRPVVQATLGVTIVGALEPTRDCESPVAAGTYEDWVVLPLKVGDKLRITLTTTTMPPGLVLRDDRLGPASPTLRVATSATPGTVTIDWIATFDSYHEIVVFKNGGASAPYGAYTLKVERLP
jgi:hypothetical protein